MFNFVNSVVDIVIVGGFFIGGVLVVEYYLDIDIGVDGLMLFFGVLVLFENVESMFCIWGIKWVVKIIDGNYVIYGLNLYKYLYVVGFVGLEFMDIIN